MIRRSLLLALAFCGIAAAGAMTDITPTNVADLNAYKTSLSHVFNLAGMPGWDANGANPSSAIFTDPSGPLVMTFASDPNGIFEFSAGDPGSTTWGDLWAGGQMLPLSASYPETSCLGAIDSSSSPQGICSTVDWYWAGAAAPQFFGTMLPIIYNTDNSGTIHIDLSTTAGQILTGFGFEANITTGDGSALMAMFYSGSDLLFSAYYDSLDYTIGDSRLFAAAGGPITGVDIMSDDPGGLTLGAFRYSYTDAVPEPATWGFLGAGLLGLAVMRRRRAS